jgi:indolepyruvate ferredoxin oxidoreductase beta subunit
MPDAARDMALTGLRAVVDFQDLDYGAEYLDRLERIASDDDPHKDHEFTREAAKYIAKAMAYDDVFRVADLKTRGSRFARVRGEIAPAEGARMKLTEFMHPRAEEIVGMMPARLGLKLSRSERAMNLIDRIFNKGRRLRTDKLLPFAQLYILGGLRKYRRGTLASCDRERTHGKLARTGDELPPDRLCTGRRDPAQSAPGQGLLRHPHARAFQVRSRDGRRGVAGRPRRCRTLVQPPARGGSRRRKGRPVEGALKTVRSFAGKGETALTGSAEPLNPEFSATD